ncbi:hypothetical protein ACS0TY_031444 [Phlomoides rotata]
MDDALHRLPAVPNGAAAHPAEEIPSDPSSSPTIKPPQSTHKIAKRKNKKKKQILVSDSASSASSNNFSCSTSNSKKGVKISKIPKRIRVGSRRSRPLSDVDALGLPLGMSIAAVFAQVLERKSAATGKMSVDQLSGICILAVRESLGHQVFEDRIANFMMNFETSFWSTLKTLRLINNSSQIDDKQLQRSGGCSCSPTCNLLSLDTLKGTAYPSEATEGESLPHRNITEQQKRAGYRDSSFEPILFSSHDRAEDSGCPSGDTDDPVAFPDGTSSDRQCHTQSQMEENVKMKPLSQQIVLYDELKEQQLACASPSTSSYLRIMERSVVEQTRLNELQTIKINLAMEKLKLKERQLELSSTANLLDRFKLSMGFSKASFQAEKFKTKLQETRQVELLKCCLDLLVTGLILMLCALAYGTYVYSHRKLIEATEACSPYTESKSSWWMPKSMSSFNSGFQLLKCQIQVFSRILFGVLLIGAVTFLIFQRSASSHQTMPLTFIVLLLAGLCGYTGKFCIDTLGGSGNHWLLYWEPLCWLHFFSNTFNSTLFTLLNGPIPIAGRVERNPLFRYWMRKLLFYATLVCLPLLCGFMPFASPGEWIDHFSDMLTYVDD